MTRRVNQRWPDGLYDRILATGQRVTDFTVEAVRAALADYEEADYYLGDEWPDEPRLLTIRVPEGLRDRALDRYGSDLGPRLRRMLEADLDGQDDADDAVAALQRNRGGHAPGGRTERRDIPPPPGRRTDVETHDDPRPCDHPKGRRLRGQCMACGWYVG